MFHRKMLLLVVSMCVASTAFAGRFNHKNFTPTEKRCYWVGDNIANIDSRMRQAYSGRLGEILKDDRRELQKMRAKCRKKRFSTKRS